MGSRKKFTKINNIFFLLIALVLGMKNNNLHAACSITLQDGKEEHTFLMSRLAQEATTSYKLRPVKEIYLSLKDEDSKLVGALYGYTIYGGSFIDMLWVDPPYRKNGHGKNLVLFFEEEIKKQGCKFINVTSMSFWNSFPFYEKLGYKIEFVREGYDRDFKMYSLVKNLI